MRRVGAKEKSGESYHSLVFYIIYTASVKQDTFLDISACILGLAVFV